MDKKVAILGLFTLAAFYGYSQTPYGIKSCKIEFVFSNGLQKGTKIIIFTDSGRLEREEGTSSFDTSVSISFRQNLQGHGIIMHYLRIQTRDSVYSFDLDSMSGSRKARFKERRMSKDWSQGGENDTLLGKICTVKDLPPLKLWYWKGILLKRERTPLSYPPPFTEYEYATEIDEDYVIKPDEFAIPMNIKWHRALEEVSW